MAGGRPTKYEADMPERAKEYALGGYLEHGHTLPTVEGLAAVLQVVDSTIDNWAKDPEKAEFLAALSIVKREQRRDLIEKGLKSEYNSTIAKLILSANHGIIEKKQTEHSGGIDLQNLSDAELDARIRHLASQQ